LQSLLAGWLGWVVKASANTHSPPLLTTCTFITYGCLCFCTCEEPTYRSVVSCLLAQCKQQVPNERPQLFPVHWQNVSLGSSFHCLTHEARKSVGNLLAYQLQQALKSTAWGAVSEFYMRKHVALRGRQCSHKEIKNLNSRVPDISTQTKVFQWMF
jgi:hypothetical protein